MTNTLLYKILTTAGIVVNAVPRLLYEFVTVSKFIYYTADALSILLFITSARFYINSRWNGILYCIAVGLAVNNFMDELFFDPLHLGLNELFSVLLITLWISWMTLKKRHLSGSPNGGLT